MIYIAWFILFFTTLQLFTAVVNLIFNQSFSKLQLIENPLISVLIPARNEEDNMHNILNDLQNQPYKNIEIIVFNDQSTDQTEKIVNQFTRSDNRIKIFNSEGLPEGWLGKNHACYSLSKFANGKWFLFLDADVRLKDNIIPQTVAFAQKHKLGLLSIFPKQIMKTWGEYITVPNMNYILLSLLPLILVRTSRFSSLSAANGQFMLFDSATYKKFDPHKRMRKSKVEDIQIARFLKNSKIKIACLTGNVNISCRMYKGFKDAVNGFSKNVIMFFGNLFSLALIFWFITTFGFLIVYLSFPSNIFWGYLLAFFLIRIFISITSRQNTLNNLFLIIPQQFTLIVFIYKAFVNNYKKQFLWKGRNISY